MFERLSTLVAGTELHLPLCSSDIPTMTGILFDLPEVVASARWEASEGRCKVIGGDMLQSVPTGGDVYLIKRVMMDKTDEEAITVLRNCIASMNKAGKILVIDPMLPSNSGASP